MAGRVVVFGSSGFIGGRMCLEAASRGLSVVGLSRYVPRRSRLGVERALCVDISHGVFKQDDFFHCMIDNFVHDVYDFFGFLSRLVRALPMS